MSAPQGLGSAALSAAESTSSFDWTSFGLLAAISGSLLFANAVLFKHPRFLVEEHFGGVPRRLVSLRGYTFRRINIYLGFLLLIGGFGMQLAGRLLPLAEPVFPWNGLVALLLGIGLAEIAAWVASQRLFLRYLKKHLRSHPEVLDRDPGLAREVGDLVGLVSAPDDTVGSYVARLKVVLGAAAAVNGAPEVLRPHSPSEQRPPLGFEEDLDEDGVLAGADVDDDELA
jgi:hypothetical protein